MSSELAAKISALKKLLTGYERVAIAFSGGVDSSFLAKVGRDALGKRAVALTVDTLFTPRQEIAEASGIAAEISIQHDILVLPDMDASILNNASDRCYLCKKMIFKTLLTASGGKGAQVLVEGSNMDDLDDFRPGIKALKELDIKSPLVEARFTKADIRKASKAEGLSTWDKPSQACLASRIPFYQKITSDSLKMVEQAEVYLRQKGIRQLRVRCHGDLARIEVSPRERRLFFDEKFMDDVSARLKKIGFRYVSIDTEGYKTGKLNI